LERCTVEQRGQSLSLRALLPGKPGSADAAKIGQRRISLHLKVGTPEAKAKTTKLAYELDRQLLDDQFQWGRWTKEALAVPAHQGDVPSFEGLCQAIEARFDAHYPDTEKSSRTGWGSKYKPAINHLRQFSGPADLEVLCRAIRGIKSDSSRKSTGSIVSVTLDHLGLRWDKAELFKAASGYQRASLKPKDIPSDQKLLEAWEAITDPRWKWVHGMCMAFGLRPSETVDCTFRKGASGVLDVPEFSRDGKRLKTGDREAWALPDEWVEELGLLEIHRPTCNRLDVARQYGDYMAKYPEHYYGGLYSLRHAYAIRGLIKGVDPALGARLMGHALKVHQDTYQHWINRDHMAQLRQRELHKFKSA
jgi:hypothetical protein